MPGDQRARFSARVKRWSRPTRSEGKFTAHATKQLVRLLWKAGPKDVHMQQQYPKPPFPAQKQPMPGLTNRMDPRPDHGETSYRGSDRLAGLKAVITGGDSGIGR